MLQLSYLIHPVKIRSVSQLYWEMLATFVLLHDNLAVNIPDIMKQLTSAGRLSI